MIKKHAAVIASVSLLAVLPAVAIAQDAETVLSNVAKAMGAENLRTIQYFGSGSSFAFGQNSNPNAPWPRFTVAMYSREIDYDAPASYVRLVRTGADKRGGGFVTTTVNQTQEQFISTSASWAQQVDIWVTPYGFLKRAMAANNAAVKLETIGGKKYHVVTYTVEDRYPLNESRENPGGDFWDVTYTVATRGKLKGYINNQNLIEKVETWIDNPVLGDMRMESTYTAYRDFAGLKFPTRIVQKQGGFPILDLTVIDVKPNAAVDIQPPQQDAGAPGAPVETERIADGVFYIKGQEHSVAVEFKDYVVVVEAPVNEARSVAVIAATKRLIPNKPIRYLINTHHHFNHLGRIRTYVDEGATIVTHQANKAFYEKIFAMPHTLVPDRLSRSKKKANIETVAGKKVLTDGRRTAELYLQKGSPHDDGLIFIYLPEEKILIEADADNPPIPQNIERLKLDIDRILPIHGPGAITRADIHEAAGRTEPANHLIVAEVEGFEANSPPWERRGGCGQGGFAIFFLMGTGARGGSFKRNCFGVGTNHPVRAFQRNGDIS